MTVPNWINNKKGNCKIPMGCVSGLKEELDSLQPSVAEYTYNNLNTIVTNNGLVPFKQYIINDISYGDKILLVAKTNNTFFTLVHSLVYYASYSYDFSINNVLYSWFRNGQYDTNNECVGHFKATLPTSGIIKLSKLALNGQCGICEYSTAINVTNISSNTSILNCNLIKVQLSSGDIYSFSNSEILESSILLTSYGSCVITESIIKHSILVLPANINLVNCDIVTMNISITFPNSVELKNLLASNKKKFIYCINDYGTTATTNDVVVEYTDSSLNKVIRRINSFT